MDKAFQIVEDENALLDETNRLKNSGMNLKIRLNQPSRWISPPQGYID